MTFGRAGFFARPFPLSFQITVFTVWGIQMEFSEAVLALSRGLKVVRKQWIEANPTLPRDQLLVFVEPNTQLLTTRICGEYLAWCPGLFDLIAADWEIDVPTPKTKQ